MKAYDVLVAGAGPAGSVTALLLARAGLCVALVEKAPFPRRKVCGEFISATSWPLLVELGVSAALAACAGPRIARVGLFARETVLAAPMPAADTSEAWGRAVAREHLDTALRDAAQDAGVDVWQPWGVRAWASTDTGHEATLEGEDGKEATLQARLVIAAHGSWERGPANAPVTHGDADLLGFKAHFEGSRLAPDLMPLVLFPGGYGGMVHVGEGRASFSCCIRRDALRRCREAHAGLGAGEAVIVHVMESCAGVRDALDGARRSGGWLSAGPIRPGVRTLAQRGVVAVGNAAGEAHPLVAEGISMAIQSAWLLAAEVAAADSLSDAALETLGARYERRWRQNFATRVRASSLFATFTMSPFTAGASIAALRLAPAVLTWGAWWSGKAQSPRIPGLAA